MSLTSYGHGIFIVIDGWRSRVWNPVVSIVLDTIIVSMWVELPVELVDASFCISYC